MHGHRPSDTVSRALIVFTVHACRMHRATKATEYLHNEWFVNARPKYEEQHQTSSAACSAARLDGVGCKGSHASEGALPCWLRVKGVLGIEGGGLRYASVVTKCRRDANAPAHLHQ